jgi:hypothetical protein
MSRRLMRELGLTKVGLRYARMIDRAYKRIWREYLRREVAYVEDLKLSELDSLIERLYNAHVNIRRAQSAIARRRLDEAYDLLNEARLQLSTALPP